MKLINGKTPLAIPGKMHVNLTVIHISSTVLFKNADITVKTTCVLVKLINGTPPLAINGKLHVNITVMHIFSTVIFYSVSTSNDEVFYNVSLFLYKVYRMRKQN